MRRSEVVVGCCGDLAHGLVQGGGECELGLAQPDGDEFVSHGDIVPRSTASSCSDLDSFGLVPRRWRAMLSSGSTSLLLIAQGMKRSTNRRVLGPSAKPGIQVVLPELIEFDAVGVEPVQEVDCHGDGLLRPKSREFIGAR